MSISIAEITARATENGDWDNLAPEGFVKNELGFNIPEDGWTGEVDAVAVNFGTTQKGNPSISIQCRDLITETKFWANLYYSDSDDSNALTVANLSAWGATPELIANAVELGEDPNDAITNAIMESAHIPCRVTHQEGEGRTFLRTSFLVPSSKPVTEDNIEEYVEFD